MTLSEPPAVRERRVIPTPAPLNPDRDDVPVLHEVVPPLDAERAFLTRRHVPAVLDQLGPADRLGFDERFHDLGVDRPCRLEGRGAAVERARDRGLLRIEGRDYVVADGDVITVKFTP